MNKEDFIEEDFSVDEIIKTVRITYNEFLWLKEHKYSFSALKRLACKYLNTTVDNIDDIDFNYKLTFEVYLNEPIKEIKKYE